MMDNNYLIKKEKKYGIYYYLSNSKFCILDSGFKYIYKKVSNLIARGKMGSTYDNYNEK